MRTTLFFVRLAIVASCVGFLVETPAALAQQPVAQAAPPAPGRGGRAPIPVDPRVQIRTYHFADTNEDIPYAIYVSSKVSRDKKNPLIVTLHGLGGTHTTMMRPNALDLAEAGGYIYVAPMGYNPRGWYGVPRGERRGGPPPNAVANTGRRGRLPARWLRPTIHRTCAS